MAESGATQNSNQNADSAKNGAQVAGAAAWLSSLPGITDDLKNNPALTRYKDPGSFIRSHLALEKKLGESVRIPGAEATDEERAQFYSKLGRPESPDKYEIKLPEGVPVDEKFVDAAKAEFHKLGLNNQQASAMAEFYVSQLQDALNAEGARLNAAVEEVKREWGHAYERNVAIAGRAIDQLEADVPGLGELLEDPHFGSHPVLIRLFHFLGRAMGEDTALDGQTRIDAEAGRELKARIDDIRRNPDNAKHKAFHDANHPMHAQVVQEVEEMYKELYGEEPVRRAAAR